MTGWRDRAARLVAEMAGWAYAVNPDDDEAMLGWARRYLPEVCDLMTQFHADFPRDGRG